MTDKILDTLIQEGDIKLVKDLVEADNAVEELIDHLIGQNKLTFEPQDKVRHTINERSLTDLTPMRISMDKIDVGYIHAPVFASPSNNALLNRYACELFLNPFTDTRTFKDTHVSTTWLVNKVELNGDLTPAHELTSIIFRTRYQIPASALEPNKTYQIKARFNGSRTSSDWSDPLRITTKSVEITQPSILTPSANAVLNKDQFKFTSSPFKTIPANVTSHASSVWQISTTFGFELLNIVWQGETPTHLTDFTFLSALLHFGTDYYVRVKYKGLLGESAWSAPIKIVCNYAIATPSILIPANNSVVSKYNFVINTSAYICDPINYKNLVSTEVIMADDENFQVIRQTFNQLGTNGEVVIASSYFEFNCTYYFKARHRGTTTDSAWSAPIKITTEKVNIKKPVLLEPLNNSQSSRISFNIRVAPFETVPANDTNHVSTIFQVSKTPVFNEVDLVYNETISSDLLHALVPMSRFLNDTDYYVRCKFVGTFNESDWSDVSKTHIYSLASIKEPIYQVIADGDYLFGNDPDKTIGKVKYERNVADTNDTITFASWLISEDEDFTDPQEKLITSYPDTLPIQLTDPIFVIGGSYWIKVAYKTVASGEFGAYTSPIHITIGSIQKPSIITLDYLNKELGSNDVILRLSEIAISENHNDKATKATIWLSNSPTFDTKEEVILDNPSVALQFHSDILKGTVYAKFKYEGYYFGESEWSDVSSIIIAPPEVPVLNAGIILFEESGTLKTYVDIISSTLVFPNRFDTHLETKWDFYSDADLTDLIISSDWCSSRYHIKQELDLTDITDVYVVVTYKLEYQGICTPSLPYHISKQRYVRKPSVVSPTENQLIDKGVIAITGSAFDAVPLSSVHKETIYILKDDLDTEVWSYITTTVSELTSYPIPDILSLGKKYHLTIQYRADDDTLSQTSDKRSFQINPVIEVPEITSPLTNSTVDEGGFDIIFSAFTIDPVDLDMVEKVEYLIASDVDFNNVMLNPFVVGNRTSISILPGSLTSSTNYWIKIRYIGYNFTSPWSNSIKITTPASSISQPSIISPTQNQTIGATLDNLLTGSAYVETATGEVPHLKTEWEYSTVSDFSVAPKTITKEYTFGTDMLNATFDPWELTAATTYYLRVRYSCGNSMSPWSATRTFITE